MMLMAYCCLVLGIPVLCTLACLALDGTYWPGYMIHGIPIALLCVFIFIVLRYAPRRRFMHMAFGIILVPIMWVVTAMILGAILISPASLDGIK